MPLAVEVEHDARHAEARTHSLGDAVLTPVLLPAAGDVEPEHDEIGVEVHQGVGDRGDLVLVPDRALGRQATRVHVIEDRVQTLVRAHARAVDLAGQGLQPGRQGRRDDVDLLCLFDEGKKRFGDLIGVGQVLVGYDKDAFCHRVLRFRNAQAQARAQQRTRQWEAGRISWWRRPHRR